MAIPFRERLTCSVKEAAEAVGLSRSKLYELMAEGRVRFEKVGYNRLVVVQSLLELVNLSPQIDIQTNPGFERTPKNKRGREVPANH